MPTNGPHTGYYYTPPAEVTSQGYFRLYNGVVAPEEPLCGLYKNKTYNTGGKMPLLASQPVHEICPRGRKWTVSYDFSG